MTRDEIMNKEAGPEMDFLMATRVMEWIPKDNMYWKDNEGSFSGWAVEFSEYSVKPFRPSTDIAAAWQVVEKMQEDGDVFIEWWNDREWFVANKPVGVRNDAITAHCDGRATGTPSAPLAICRAALLAVMESEE